MTKERIQQAIDTVLQSLGVSDVAYTIEFPNDMSHGDYATNVALAIQSRLAEAVDSHVGEIHNVGLEGNPRTPREVAELITPRLSIEGVKEITIAGPGFINFTLAPEFFATEVARIIERRDHYGMHENLSGQRIMVEYTDPNPFKQFHIGHLMSNTVGESIARLFESQGASVLRANYQGDVGLHVAKALWALMRREGELPADNATLEEKVAFLGSVYTEGANEYEDNEEAKIAIDALNKVIFDRSDEHINELYAKGRTWSLAHFEEIYAKLGTAFDHYFFESEVAEKGMDIVETSLQKGIFEESDGAIIYPGEKHGLHNRVFVNSRGLPTYETKELGLNTTKFEVEPDLDQSIIVTADEQTQYFKVVLAALAEIAPLVTKKTRHIAHGMLRFAEGKMSSRKGNIVTGESLVTELTEIVHARMAEHDRGIDDTKSLANDIAVGAFKYQVLRQAFQKNIIFDRDQALSLEGDSGPYLQYTHARACSIVEKAPTMSATLPVNWETIELERLLVRFPEVMQGAFDQLAPHHIAQYLIELARAFNSWYAQDQIITDDIDSPYRVSLARACAIVLAQGLHTLGIKAPTKM